MRLSVHFGDTLATCRSGTLVLVPSMPPDNMVRGVVTGRFLMSEKDMVLVSRSTMGKA